MRQHRQVSEQGIFMKVTSCSHKRLFSFFTMVLRYWWPKTRWYSSWETLSLIFMLIIWSIAGTGATVLHCLVFFNCHMQSERLAPQLSRIHAVSLDLLVRIYKIGNVVCHLDSLLLWDIYLFLSYRGPVRTGRKLQVKNAPVLVAALHLRPDACACRKLATVDWPNFQECISVAWILAIMLRSARIFSSTKSSHWQKCNKKT